ncbi:hypothetical protein Q5H93_06740 [Hymenobacter sp. ASUV-10]|uniref:Uncharacterized protein n=1 Tax=Hymenobacter aranciens TaxID=3063996 RepID=A0ABT9B827_9BACT|nr:hypothetical protein [Hymenobacter sp. ASUV-10]MDO7874424.1 hypothetical protein [Hymenobacter sp. ASUV-10]
MSGGVSHLTHYATTTLTSRPRPGAGASARSPFWPDAGLLLGLTLPVAQAPTWTDATIGSSVQNSGTTTVAQPRASTANEYDIVVAKYTDNGTSASLGWVHMAGGTGVDIGYDIAASGTSVYVTGVITNSAADASLVRFGRTGSTASTIVQPGASTANTRNLVVDKYTDKGSSATFDWSQVGGGRETDAGYVIATATVDGVTNVYVTGQITSNLSDNNTVRLGGSGTTAGTEALAGASTAATKDVVVANYADAGSAASMVGPRRRWPRQRRKLRPGPVRRQPVPGRRGRAHGYFRQLRVHHARRRPDRLPRRAAPYLHPAAARHADGLRCHGRRPPRPAPELGHGQRNQQRPLRGGTQPRRQSLRARGYPGRRRPQQQPAPVPAARRAAARGRHHALLAPAPGR